MLPIQKWPGALSLCQGGVWWHSKGWLWRGWQLAGVGGAGGTSQVAVGVAASYDHQDELADVIFHATGYSI